MSVTVFNDSPIRDYVHLDDQTQPTFELTPGFKPFTEGPLSALDAFSTIHELAFPQQPVTIKSWAMMCNTTYRTSLCDDNCGLRNFQHAVSTVHVYFT